MKNIPLFLLIALSISQFVSCSQKPKNESPWRTIIAGKIENLDVYPEYRVVTVEVPGLNGGNMVFSDSIKEDGTFRVEFDLYITQDVNFLPIVRTFMAHPGDSIYVDIDFKDIGYVNFSGDFAKTNQDYHRYVNSYYHVDYYRSLREVLNLEDHIAFCDSVKQKMLEKREEYISEVNPGDELLKWTSDYIQVNYSLAILNYLLSQNYFHDNPESELTPPAEYHTLVKDIETMFDSEIITGNAYQLLNYLMAARSRQKTPDFSIPEDTRLKTVIEEVNRDQQNEVLRQLLVGSVFHNDFMQNDVDFYENNLALFDQIITIPFIREPLKAFYSEVKNRMENPMVFHNQILSATFNTLAGRLMDSIMEANKGKVLYLYLWTTWCGPCIESFPDLNLLADQQKGEEVAFSLVCLGSTRGEWESLLERHQVIGSHYFCTIDESQSLFKQLKINAIPDIFLIDKKGIFRERSSYLSAKNPKIQKKIERLLGE